MTQTYDARTGQWRDYASLAGLLDTSDMRGMSTQAAPPPPMPLLWIECPICGTDVPFESADPCPACHAQA